MKLANSFAALLVAMVSLSGSLLAQTPAPPASANTAFQVPRAHGLFTDPANLRGERIAPITGRELPVDQSVLGLEQLLRKLDTRASILNIVAHPDDEDGGMLTLYARGMGARVADISLTRGEGGQNAMTGDFEDALGLIRTQELLANDRYTGVEQMFGTEVDFGFSKTKAESFAKWNHERVLYDVVRAIRIFRPLVITATFIGEPTDGHGQHQVSGEIAQEAFVAAGDPKIFPELTAEGILPWQPLKMYARVPRGAVSARGLFDYATGQFVPARFVNYITGAVTNTIPSVDVVVHEGATDPLLTRAAANGADLSEKFLADTSATKPLSYVQFARIGLGLQRSQIGPGMRVPSPGAAFDVGYHLYGSCLPGSDTRRFCHLDQSALSLSSQPHAKRSGRGVERPLAAEPNFFDGIDTTLLSLQDVAHSVPAELLPLFAEAVASAADKFEPADPSSIAPLLADAIKKDDSLIDFTEKWKGDAVQKENMLHELRIKRVQLNDALVLALGLRLDATAPHSDVVTKTPVRVHILATTDTDQRVPYFSEELETSAGTIQRGPLSDGEPAVTKARPWNDDINASPRLTRDVIRPYFFRGNIEQSTYQLHNDSLRDAAATPAALVAWMNLHFNGVDLRIGRVVHDGSQPLSIVPAASLALAPRTQVLPNSDRSTRFLTELHPSATPAVVPTIAAPPGWKTSRVVTDVLADGFTFFQLEAPALPRSTIKINAEATLAHTTVITEGYRAVGYPGLILTNYFTPATDRIVPVDLKLPKHHRIAYVEGTGDAVPEALGSIGLTPMVLKVSDLNAAMLANFDTVVLGVRTYSAHPDLQGAPTAALLAFARGGGNVVVQYQTDDFTSADAPYPLELGNSPEKVVDETAPVALTGTSPLLTVPNAITPADFHGWIEERGHGFLRSWDPRYTALTETHDPGVAAESVAPQLPQRGGLITARIGKGRWTYCAFALYRQLPEAVPGAYRLFVNLLNP